MFSHWEGVFPTLTQKGLKTGISPSGTKNLSKL